TPQGFGERADHAGVSLCVDLHQAAGDARRRDGDRPDPDRAGRIHPDRPARRHGIGSRHHGDAGGVRSEPGEGEGVTQCAELRTAFVTDVFISYKREERAHVERIEWALRELDVDVWFDWRLTPGLAFTDEILAAAHTAKAIVVCWSPSACISEWVQ